jgi:hypothetical protein
MVLAHSDLRFIIRPLLCGGRSFVVVVFCCPRQAVHAAPLRWFVRECFAPLAPALGRWRDPPPAAAAGAPTTNINVPPLVKQEL